MGNGSVELTNVYFKNNTAQNGNGSVVYIDNRGTITVNNGKFYKNLAKYSGTIYVGVGISAFSLINVIFDDNDVTLGHGSVLYVPTSSQNVSLNIVSGNFTNNFAGITGTIYFNGDILTMDDSAFINNIAQDGDASGIYMPNKASMYYLFIYLCF